MFLVPAVDIVHMILEVCKDKNPKDSGGQTPLHTSAIEGHSKIVQMILHVAEDKNPKDEDGNTPLHGAAERGHTDIVKMILAVVEDKNPKNSNGDTPASLANKQVRQLLVPNFTTGG